jgi:hypothetical protein
MLLPLVVACHSDESGIDPGRVVLRRLNRAEYDNTVRDLFGTAQHPADQFPADDFGLGFDNIGSVLSISPLHVEMYDLAADQLLDELFSFGALPADTWSWEAESGDWQADNGGLYDVTGWVLFEDGALTRPVWVTTAGDYTVSADAFGQEAGDEDASMAVVVDGVRVATFDLPAESARYDARVPLTVGQHRIGVEFLNDFKSPPDLDRNLVVDRMVFSGPLDVPRPPAPGKALVIDCDPQQMGEPECAEHVARTFGRRAWRRPLTEDEVASVMRGYGVARELGGSWEEGVRAELKALLLSPNFVYLVEVDPVDGPRELTGFELAARLSYFLWSSTPDDRLLDLAQTGALREPATLETEARRMLADPRSDALIDNLAGQWLGIRKVDAAAPNPEKFPEWDSELQASMKDELTDYVRDVLRGDRPLQDLLTSEDTWLDARLAEHYGVPAPEGEGMQPAVVPGRAGLLARGGLLAALAYPTRTSPVVRGNWVLGNLLCSPPPPPPPGIPPLDEEPAEPISLREELEQHRADPACAVCHDQMDAIGLSMEEYDAIGRFRDVDDYGFPIDATGSLDGLGSFDGVAQLQALLAQDPRFPQCAVEKTFTYATGRGPTDADQLTLDELLVNFAGSGYRFEDLVLDIVMSRPFRWRNGDAP